MIKINNNEIEISFVPVHETKQKLVQEELVIDLNSFNQVIGVEAINFIHNIKSQYPSYLWSTSVIFSKISKDFYLSYDNDEDVFYLSLSDDLSITQQVVMGTLIFDESMHLLAIKFNLRF